MIDKRELEERLDGAIDREEITEEEAREIMRDAESNDRDREEWEERGH